MVYDHGQTVKVIWGSYKGILGTYLRWSGESNLHIVRVPKLNPFDRTCPCVETALRDGEFEVPA